MSERRGSHDRLGVPMPPFPSRYAMGQGPYALGCAIPYVWRLTCHPLFAMRDDRSSGSCRVVLAGWYGAANFGDELLLMTIAGWVRAAGGTAVALSVHPTYTHAALGIEAVPF